MSQNEMIIVIPIITILNNVPMCILLFLQLYYFKSKLLIYSVNESIIICNHIIVVIEVLETANKFSIVKFSRV